VRAMVIDTVLLYGQCAQLDSFALYEGQDGRARVEEYERLQACATRREAVSVAANLKHVVPPHFEDLGWEDDDLNDAFDWQMTFPGAGTVTGRPLPPTTPPRPSMRLPGSTTSWTSRAWKRSPPA